MEGVKEGRAVAARGIDRELYIRERMMSLACVISAWLCMRPHGASVTQRRGCSRARGECDFSRAGCSCSMDLFSVRFFCEKVIGKESFRAIADVNWSTASVKNALLGCILYTYSVRLCGKKIYNCWRKKPILTEENLLHRQDALWLIFTFNNQKFTDTGNVYF